MAKFFSAQMGSKGAERRRPEALLWSDYHNSDPFNGAAVWSLPLPIEPSSVYDDLTSIPLSCKLAQQKRGMTS